MYTPRTTFHPISLKLILIVFGVILYTSRVLAQPHFEGKDHHVLQAMDLAQKTELHGHVDQLVIWVLFDVILLVPGAGAQNHGPPLSVLHEEGTRRRLERADVPDDPSTALVRQGRENGFHPVFVFQPVLHHLKLQLSHSGKNIFSVNDLQQLNCTFLGELQNAFVESLSLAHVFWVELRKNFGLELRQWLEVETASKR